MHVDQVVEQMLNDPDVAVNIAAYREIPARQADLSAFPPSVDPRLVSALRARGIEAPYAHQAGAVEEVLNGKNVVVVTPTASGKTLCYNIPTLNAILADDTARALYL